MGGLRRHRPRRRSRGAARRRIRRSRWRLVLPLRRRWSGPVPHSAPTTRPLGCCSPPRRDTGSRHSTQRPRGWTDVVHGRDEGDVGVHSCQCGDQKVKSLQQRPANRGPETSCQLSSLRGPPQSNARRRSRNANSAGGAVRCDGVQAKRRVLCRYRPGRGRFTRFRRWWRYCAASSSERLCSGLGGRRTTSRSCRQTLRVSSLPQLGATL